MSDPKKTTLRALSDAMGDDLERATIAFRNYTQEELDTQYGQSGQTCREILDGYKAHRKTIEAAIEWVKGIP